MVAISLLPVIVSCTFRTSVLSKTSTLFSSTIVHTFLLSVSKSLSHSNFYLSKMASTIDPERAGRLEKNAQTAENLIADIYSKLADIEKSSRNDFAATPQLSQLRNENEELRMEVAKWKELLIIREIRNGGNPVVRSPANVGRSASAHVKKSQSAAAAVLASSVPSTTRTNANAGQKKPSTATVPSNKPSKTNNNAAKPTSGAAPAKKEAKKGQEKKPQEASQESNSPAAPGEEIDVSKLDMRIGRIVECIRHADADALYVETIDLGEEKPRTIISGLVKHVPIEQMQNRLVVVLANLKPAKMRGILSEGMVMCASSPEKVEILIPPQGSVPGDVVEVEGFPRKIEGVMNPKKKIFETVQPDLKTNDKREATYKGNLWVVPGKGVVVTESLVNTMIK